MLINADIVAWANAYDGPLFHAVLCDAPYHLTDVHTGGVDIPGKFGARTEEQKAARSLARKGFMGQSWDGVDEDGIGVAFNPDTWRAIARCLHPGAFLFVYAGTLNDDLISVAMRQAGLRKFHRSMAWNYSTGFPKATRIDTQVDRNAGATRATIGTSNGARSSGTYALGRFASQYPTTAPATDMAKRWAGHRYGGQALKPSLESILIFQKPYAGRPVDSITTTGAGALNIEQARIGWDAESLANDQKRRQSPGNDIRGGHYIGGINGGYDKLPNSPSGRWPANLCLAHHPLCDPRGVRRVKGHAGDADYTPTGNQGPTSIITNVKTGAHYGDETIQDWACHPDCAVARLGEQSGETTSNWREDKGTFGGTFGNGQPASASVKDYGGNAARYFFNASYMLERLEAADLLLYCAKASRSEREAGLDPRQIALLREWAGVDEIDAESAGVGALRDGNRGSSRRNTHATVKPLTLSRQLATLLLPPPEYAPRRLLVPFAGVASEVIGALLAGWDEVVGVELEQDHVSIGNARIAYWQQRRWELMHPDTKITATAAPTMDGQLDMFYEDE